MVAGLDPGRVETAEEVRLVVDDDPVGGGDDPAVAPRPPGVDAQDARDDRDPGRASDLGDCVDGAVDVLRLEDPHVVPGEHGLGGDDHPRALLRG
ncbi:hypothetical protein ABIB53_000340 [Janibacter sp. UYMM211]